MTVIEHIHENFPHVTASVFVGEIRNLISAGERFSSAILRAHGEIGAFFENVTNADDAKVVACVRRFQPALARLMAARGFSSER